MSSRSGCAGSALMPEPYGVRGGYRATFTGSVLEYSMKAGYTGQGPATLTEYTAGGERSIDLPTTSPYAAVIDHVLVCLREQTSNRIDPAGALPALTLTLDVHQRLTGQCLIQTSPSVEASTLTPPR